MHGPILAGALLLVPVAALVTGARDAQAAACVPNERGTDTETILTFRTVGTCQWTVPSGVTSVRALVVGGGGGGGSDNGGGGGAGGVLHSTNVAVTPGTAMNVVVGAGGNGAVNASSVASNGGNSSFATLVARGGGGGGSIDNTAGADGGSAGGRAANRWGGAQSAIVTTSPEQGNDGGGKNSGGFGGGGGGGATSAGGAGGSNLGGNGGAGYSSDIDENFQELRTYGGGGGGGGDSNTPGSGGNGGGGDGSWRGDAEPTAGQDGYGGGGGGAGGSIAGGLGARGGSGVVILRFTRTVSTYAVIYEGYQATLTAPTGRTFTGISYASYGTPSGAYGTYTNGSCHEPNTKAILLPDVVGATSVTLNSSNGVFGDPCGGTYKWLAVSLTLSAAPATTTIPTTTVVASTTTAAPAATTTTVAASSPTTVAPALVINVDAPTSSVASPTQATLATATRELGNGTGSPLVGTIKGDATATTTTTSTTLPGNAGGTVAPKAPVVDAVDPGKASVTVGGEASTVDVGREGNQLVVTAGRIKATVGALDSSGAIAPLDPEGNVRLNPGDPVRVNAEGFKPGTTVRVWLLSTPTLLGSVKVAGDGSVSASFTVPKGVSNGSHRIVIEATTAEGKPATLAVGVKVGNWTKEQSMVVWLIVLPIVLAVIAALVLPATRRRRPRTTA